MTWDQDQRALLERCVADANEGKAVNSGQLSRFYKTLADCPSLSSPSPPDVDRRASLSALSVAGRPPLDTTRRAESTLLALTRNSRVDAIQQAAALALADYWSAHDPTEPTSARALLALSAFDATQRFRFALVAGEDQDLEVAADLVHETDLHVDDLKAIQEGILARDEQSEAELRLLEELYVNGSWLGRRILIRQLGPGHERLVPTLARVASRADPTTRRAVVAALERVGHVSAEPILVSLLDDVEPAVLSDVLGALGTLGTRACLARLSALREEHPRLAEDVDVTIELISDRFPVDARAGGLSLAEEGPAGALSLAGASPGDVSLYRDVEHKLAQTALAPRPETTALSSQEHWHRLVTGPRDVPLAFTLREIGIGRWGASFASWLALTFTLAALTVEPFAIIHGAAFTIALMIAGAFHYPRRRRVLREGTPAYAELTDYEVVRVGDNTRHEYTFQYMDEAEQTHSTTLTFNHSMPKIADDPLEPILFTEGNEIMLFDEVGHLTVASDGTLTTTSSLNMLGMLGPLLATWSAIYLLFTLLG
jgi:hypothetical protein